MAEDQSKSVSKAGKPKVAVPQARAAVQAGRAIRTNGGAEGAAEQSRPRVITPLAHTAIAVQSLMSRRLNQVPATMEAPATGQAMSVEQQAETLRAAAKVAVPKSRAPTARPSSGVALPKSRSVRPPQQAPQFDEIDYNHSADLPAVQIPQARDALATKSDGNTRALGLAQSRFEASGVEDSVPPGSAFGWWIWDMEPHEFCDHDLVIEWRLDDRLVETEGESAEVSSYLRAYERDPGAHHQHAGVGAVMARVRGARGWGIAPEISRLVLAPVSFAKVEAKPWKRANAYQVEDPTATPREPQKFYAHTAQIDTISQWISGADKSVVLGQIAVYLAEVGEPIWCWAIAPWNEVRALADRLAHERRELPEVKQRVLGCLKGPEVQAAFARVLEGHRDQIRALADTQDQLMGARIWRARMGDLGEGWPLEDFEDLAREHAQGELAEQERRNFKAPRARQRQ